MRKRPFSSERHKTNQRSGPDRAAESAYDPKSWAAGVWTIKKKLEVSGLQAFLALIDRRSQVKWRRDR
ncbi:hypothetical protein CXF70_17180 [Planomicrobium sp. MB-3u-38]|nr:hypothetical protein CXF70_17180 [Planomicrobium sp. MB-3u-38]